MWGSLLIFRLFSFLSLAALHIVAACPVSRSPHCLLPPFPGELLCPHPNQTRSKGEARGVRERAFQTYLQKYPGIDFSFPKVANGGARIWPHVDDHSKLII